MNFTIFIFIFGGYFVYLTTSSVPLTTQPEEKTKDYTLLFGAMYLRARISDFLYYHQLHQLTPDSPDYHYRRAVLDVFTELDHFLSKPNMLKALKFNLTEFLTSLENIRTNKKFTHFYEKTKLSPNYLLYLVGEYFFPQQTIPEDPKRRTPPEERLMIIVINHFYDQYISKILNPEWIPLKNRFKEVVKLGKQRHARDRKRKFVLWCVSTSLIIWATSTIIFKLKK